MDRRIPDSTASSSIGLQPISLNPNAMHSQTWTEVNEFYMGGRQQKILDPHECWKYDVQCQIAAMEDKVRESQDEFPDIKENAGGIGRKPTASASDIHSDFEKKKLEWSKQQNQSGTSSLTYGLGRNGHNQRRPTNISNKFPNAITNATEVHLGLMDTTLHGAVLGPNTGRSFNTGLKR